MHRSGNPRFDCAVSTGGARGPRVDHPSSEGVVLISPLAETNRKAASHRYAFAVAGEHLHVALLRRFYAAHNYEPVWDSHQAQATALTPAITRAGEHGLDPELFHATALRNAASLPATERDQTPS